MLATGYWMQNRDTKQTVFNSPAARWRSGDTQSLSGRPIWTHSPRVFHAHRLWKIKTLWSHSTRCLSPHRLHSSHRYRWPHRLYYFLWLLCVIIEDKKVSQPFERIPEGNSWLAINQQSITAWLIEITYSQMDLPKLRSICFWDGNLFKNISIFPSNHTSIRNMINSYSIIQNINFESFPFSQQAIAVTDLTNIYFHNWENFSVMAINIIQNINHKFWSTS